MTQLLRHIARRPPGARRVAHTQNRDTRALQLKLKLDELIRGMGEARTHLVRLEHLSDEELAEIEDEFARLREAQRDRPDR